MSVALKEILKEKIKEKNISVAELERSAGVKISAVRNIINGTSKNPGIEVVQALAKALNCSMDSLCGLAGYDGTVHSLEYKIPLLRDTIQVMLDVLEKKKTSLSVQKFNALLLEIYSFFERKEDPKVDKDFVVWFLDKNLS